MLACSAVKRRNDLTCENNLLYTFTTLQRLTKASRAKSWSRRHCWCRKRYITVKRTLHRPPIMRNLRSHTKAGCAIENLFFMRYMFCVCVKHIFMGRTDDKRPPELNAGSERDTTLACCMISVDCTTASASRFSRKRHDTPINMIIPSPVGCCYNDIQNHCFHAPAKTAATTKFIPGKRIGALLEEKKLRANPPMSWPIPNAKDLTLANEAKSLPWSASQTYGGK